LNFRESKSLLANRRREQVQDSLRDALRAILSEYNRGCGTDPIEYERIENAAFQFEHKDREGAFPYAPSDLCSVENDDHTYSVSKGFANRKMFMKHLHDRKVITSYSPVKKFGGLNEARCIKHALDFCQAPNSKSRSMSKRYLQAIYSTEPDNSDFAERYLNMITGQETSGFRTSQKPSMRSQSN
jgi:hypothetical protein